MKVSVTFRNAESNSWHNEYVDERLKKLKKYIDTPVEARVVLSVEKFRNVAEINLLANGLNVNAKEEDKEMHLAIDAAVDKIERQLRKRREKTRDHKAPGNRSEKVGEGEGIGEESEEDAGTMSAMVAETRKLALKPMSLEDALFEITTTKNWFLIYRDSNTESVNVLYRRDDGKFALIETSC